MKKIYEKYYKGLSKEAKNLTFNIAFMVLAGIIVIVFHKNIVLTTVLELILAAIGLAKWKSKITTIIFVVGGILGPLSEAIVIYTSGAWSYMTPSILNLIPLWLFVIWADASAIVYETSKELKRMGFKK